MSLGWAFSLGNMFEMSRTVSLNVTRWFGVALLFLKWCRFEGFIDVVLPRKYTSVGGMGRACQVSSELAGRLRDESEG